jgi:hypothetical protein
VPYLLNLLKAACLAALACSVAHAGLIVGTRAIGNSGVGATDATGVVVNTDGIGHVLVVPYFNAQGGNVSILSIINTDIINGKAVKVRYRGASNADNLLNLTVFLAPGDVWNAAVSQNAESGIAQLSSDESSCTLPSLMSGQLYSFGTGRLNPALSASDKASQTREGYIEIITLADIPQSSASDSLFKSIAPAAGSSRNCGSAAVLATLTDAADETSAAALGFGGPTGSLRASWTNINVSQTLTYSGNALAIMAINQASGLPGRGAYMVYPQSSVSAGNADAATADPLLRSGTYASKSATGRVSTYISASLPLVKPLMSDLPDLSTPLVSGLADPMAYTAMVSKVMAVKAVHNDYATDPAIEASTDWVFSFPTKRFSVAFDYVQSKPVYNLMTGYEGTEFFSDANSTFKDAKACSDQVFTFYDRDETSKSVGDNVLAASAYVKLCGAVATVPFGTSPVSAIGASITAEPTVNRAFVNGWGRIDTSNGYTGTPVFGSAFIRARNANASPGVSGNYGINSGHKYLR